MDVKMCDWDECTAIAFYTVSILEGDWKGSSFDACEQHAGEGVRKWLRRWERELEALPAET